jgi:phospholipid/cholesterol/gamma-HCH transport system substrate-binding protein
MNRNILETALGALVLVTAISFLIFGLGKADASRPSGYQVKAAFTKIDGVNVGADVRVSGIKSGIVSDMKLDENFRAIITMDLKDDIKLPTDSAAVIASGGFLGDKFIALEPGGDEEILKNGDIITITQSPPGLEQLLGQVIFSMTKQNGNDTAATPQPVNTPATTPITPEESMSE